MSSARSSRLHNTESVSVMGQAWSLAVRVRPTTELQSLLYPACRVYQASLTLGYMTMIRTKIRVSFLRKPGKDDYTTAKIFWANSLTSFLLKGLEKVVDRIRYPHLSFWNDIVVGVACSTTGA